MSALTVLHVEPAGADASLTAGALRDVWPGEFAMVRVRDLPAALGRVRGGLVDCVLYSLESEEGLLALLRERPSVPVVVLTAEADEEAGVRAVRCGAQDYLVKGTDGYALGRAIRFAVERDRRAHAVTGRASSLTKSSS